MKKKITVINEFPIYPPKHGGQFRIYNQYKYLSKHFIINYLCFDGDIKSISKNQLAEDFFEIRVPKNIIHKYIDKISPHIILYFYDKFISLNDINAMLLAKYNSLFIKTLSDLIEESDIVVANHCYLYSLIQKYKNKPKIYESLNNEALLKESCLNYKLTRPFVKMVRKVEEEASKDCDYLFATSQTDKEIFEKEYGIKDKIFIIPNGVDTNSIKPVDSLEKKKLKQKLGLDQKEIVLFVGSGHPPNVEAANFIINNIAPELPDKSFLIMGNVCWLLNKNSIPSNITLLFEVNEEKKLHVLNATDIAINPISSGSGTNIKMLDYFAAGIPTISTPVGVRGLNCIDKEHVVVSELNSFTESVKEIFRNEEYSQFLSQNCRNFVENNFSCDRLSLDINKYLNQILERN